MRGTGCREFAAAEAESAHDRPPQPHPQQHQPVERFKPTGGQFWGTSAWSPRRLRVGYVVLDVHTVTGLQFALGAVFFGVVVWVTQLRPRATAYPTTSC